MTTVEIGDREDSPPHLHSGRALTLEDTVEFFNLVLELKLTGPQKADLVALENRYQCAPETHRGTGRGQSRRELTAERSCARGRPLRDCE